MAVGATSIGAARYRSLDPEKVVATIEALRRRIAERFPDAGLERVCTELLVIAKENSARAHSVAAANLPLRVAIFVVLGGGAVALVWILAALVATIPAATDNVYSLLQGLEAAVNLTVLIGAAVFFLTQIEQRLKRREALAALHEMRSIMHVIDMHQLTKDPSAMSVGGTASSPPKALSPAQTARYLDYCSEMLSLSAKVAVLFAQGFPDTAVIDTVSDIERLGTGLSQKIWQKIIILQAQGT